MTKATKKKLVYSVGMAAVGVLTDLSLQLASPAAMDYTRTMIVGLVMGGVARILGAYLAAAWLDDDANG